MPLRFAIVHALLVVAAAALAAAIARRSPRAARRVALVVFALSALQVAAYLRPRALAALSPDVFFFSELHLELAAALAVATPLALEGRGPRIRAAVLGALLVAASGARFAQLYTVRTGWGAGFVEEGVVHQTERGSCAPAAAATLLRCLGIERDATEARLAELCFTDKERGTHDLALLHGLALSAPGHSVRFARRAFDELRVVAPCIGFVGLERGRAGAEFESLRRDYQWNDGEYHAVVIFAVLPPRSGEEWVLIGDPAYGLERWPLRHFRALWDGSTLEVR